MRLQTFVLHLVLATFFAPFSALADAEEVVQQRQENQEKRIQQGTNSGQLTNHEVQRLENEEERVQQMNANAQKDGKTTKKEAHRIHRAQNKVSHDIARKKHNRRHQ